jgi:hypothetical protein
MPGAGRRDCGGGLGTAAGNGSRLNGDGGAAVLRRLSGSWTGKNPWRREWLGENLLHSIAGRTWCYSVGGGQARDMGEICVSAGEKYGRKVFPT